MFNISVNCYLVRTGEGCTLIDTGKPNKRDAIEKELEHAGYQPGNLRLIVLTHGDADHCGNAAYLRKKSGAIIAIHRDDSGMVERGDMFWNRKTPNIVVGTVMNRFFGLRQADRFRPDLYVEEGDDLSGYGFEASILHIPGHSKGSIGILTADGDLFCGDLLANTGRPGLWSMIDDLAAANNSVEKLRSLEIRTVYPGHGRPFAMEQFMENDGPA